MKRQLKYIGQMKLPAGTVEMYEDENGTAIHRCKGIEGSASVYRIGMGNHMIEITNKAHIAYFEQAFKEALR